ncbi:hypothetical protein SK355_00910 [Candidatus Fukatsuia symbiotica]|uniref:Uncharacterized protein n=1 Tax=Candidatus Fukatsuia symbiotica TaxID=1878942 RepID=A0A2U8IAD9_9GAMM|nr:hypothetical protein [Candidatus Fukatsuia symbiotica]AWK15105.1 hypothetical protein CCS41_12505 [Candidatus Fukatsuia symbiotica]MEA9443919.1 hypothetical protein [Candidatus Fukatsuia symbiotica]
MANGDFTQVHNDDLGALFEMIDQLVFTNEILNKQVLDLEDYSIAIQRLKNTKVIPKNNTFSCCIFKPFLRYWCFIETASKAPMPV